MSIGKAFRTVVLLSFLFAYAASAHAAWQGPIHIVSGVWGSDNGQFAINYGDSGDQFPTMIVVSGSGKILIGDSINKRIQVFNADGSFSNLIMPKGFPASYPPVIQWPLSLFICGDSSIYTRRNEYLQIYGVNGDLLQNFTTIRGGIAFVDQQCNFYTFNPSTNQYFQYSPAGQLISTSTTKPLEFGVVKSQKLAENNYKITVSYPDKVYGLLADREFMRYVRDVRGFVYGVNAGGVWRFNECGKLTGTVLMPSSQIQETPRSGGGENFITVEAEYGRPVVASNGDVYTWKRADKYSILKWTWKDDPDTSSGCGEEPTSKGK